MEILKSDYRIRAAQVEELPLLSYLERSAAVLFLDTPYEFQKWREKLAKNEGEIIN